MNEQTKAAPPPRKKIKRVDVFQLIQLWLDERRVGNIQLNFYLGGISSVKMDETLKTGEDVKVVADRNKLKPEKRR